MANKLVLQFAFQFEGDGVATSVSTVLATGPIAFYPVGGTGGAPEVLSSVTNGVPSGVTGVSCAGLTVTSASLSLLNTVLTVNFSSAPANGSFYTVGGTLEF